MGFIIFIAEYFLFCALGIIIASIGIYLLIPQIKKVQFLYFGVIFTTLGAIELILAFGGILEGLTVLSIIGVGEPLIGGMFFVIGMVFLGCVLLSTIISGLSYLLKPILGFMRTIMVRNVLRNSRRTQNTFAMISIGLAFLITVSTLTTSLSAGIYPGAKLSMGGDMRVGWTVGYLPFNFTSAFRNVEHVTAVAATWSFYSNSIIDNPTTNYNIQFYVINTSEYAKLHEEPTLLESISPSGLSVHDFIHRLEQENSTILFHKLGESLGKDVGNYVNATSSLFNSTILQIVGLCGRMPGMWYTFHEYSFPTYVAIISWNTLFTMTGYNVTTFPYYIYFNIGLDDISNDVVVRTEFTSIIEQFQPVHEYAIQSVRTQVEDFSGIINTVDVILNQILIIALIVSLLGLSITMNISIRQRRTEIGILRAMGISKRQILSMIFGETLTISLAGILFGSIIGISTAFFMINSFPFIEWLAVIFTISWTTLAIYWSILIGVSLFSSIIPSYNLNKMEIIESIRMRGK